MYYLEIKTNSKKIKKGDTFIAIKGKTFDGHDFIEEAINNGAKKIIAEYGKYSVETIIVNDTKEYLYKYLSKYDELINKIKIIGVTGTNGKTTTAFLVYNALKRLNIKSSYIGTIGFYIDEKIYDLERTTPEINEIYDMLLKCVDSNVKVVVMEVSSHALEEGRVKNIKFNQAIFTNITQDHLDYHKTMNNYINAKAKLFRQISTNGTCIINIDDKNSKYMIDENNNNVTYGFNNSTYHVINYNYYLDKMVINYEYNMKKYKICTKLLGKFNVYNIMSVVASLKELNISIESVNRLVECLDAPKGRFEQIKYNNSIIIVDYAHTPDAVKNVLNTAKEFSIGKIYCIIGCGGNRDKTKRQKMATIAMSLSDKVIITSDNPRTEDPNEIIKDMLHDNKMSNYIIELDRSKAIKKAILMLKSNDILLILGKGHENYQIIGEKKYHFDDIEEVYKYIKR